MYLSATKSYDFYLIIWNDMTEITDLKFNTTVVILNWFYAWQLAVLKWANRKQTLFKCAMLDGSIIREVWIQRKDIEVSPNQLDHKEVDPYYIKQNLKRKSKSNDKDSDEEENI